MVPFGDSFDSGPATGFQVAEMEEAEHWIEIGFEDFEGVCLAGKVEVRAGGLGVEKELPQCSKGGNGGYRELGEAELLIGRVSVEDIALYEAAFDGAFETWGFLLDGFGERLLESVLLVFFLGFCGGLGSRRQADEEEGMEAGDGGTEGGTDRGRAKEIELEMEIGEVATLWFAACGSLPFRLHFVIVVGFVGGEGFNGAVLFGFRIDFHILPCCIQDVKVSL